MPAGPEIPDWADARDLDPAVRAALRGLDPRNAERVARHLVAAGTLVDDDAEQALAHARAARDRASRIAAVREAVGVAAYHAGDYAEAARELRAYRRMSGDQAYRAVLADCERALGRPEVALRLVAEALADSPDAEELIELRLVEAGVRQDLGELPAARLLLEDALGGRPAPESIDMGDAGQLRLAAAYADLLQAGGEEERAAEWRAVVSAAEPDVEFELGEDEEFEADQLEAEESEAEQEADEPAAAEPVAEDDPSAASAVDTAPEEPGEGDGDGSAAGYDLEADAAAEVAELLGEDDGPSSEAEESPEH